MHTFLNTYTRRKNNWRWRKVKLCDIERLSEEICRIELVERNGPRGLGSLRWHLMRITHAHGTKLLGHLRNPRHSRGNVSLSHGLLHLGCWVYPVHGLGLGLRNGLLVSRRNWLHWLLRRVSSVATTGRHLTPQSCIGSRAESKRLTSINPLLLTPSLALKRRSGLGGRAIFARLTVPFLGRVASLW